MVVPKFLDHSWMDHLISVDYVFNDSRIATRDYSDPVPAKIDLLIAQWTHSPPYPEFAMEVLAKYAAVASARILNYDAEFGGWWSLIKQQLKLIRSSPWVFTTFRRVMYRTGWHPFDLFSFFSSRKPVAIGPNFNQFVDEKAKYSLCQPWEADLIRPGFVNYFGSYETPERRPIITAIQGLGRKKADAIIFSESSLDLPNVRPNQVWSFGNGYSWDDYPRALTLFDFTLCPQGGLPWAHRTVEALMRGSIPIVPGCTAPYFSDLLADGVTCLFVNHMNSPKCWRKTVEAALELPLERRQAMRRAIQMRIRPWLVDLCGEMRRRAGVPD